MSIRRAPTLNPAALAARRANARKSTGPRTPEGKLRVSENLAEVTRHFDRLLGLPEATILDQEPGLAVHLFYELIAPYEPAPPLLAMHFRDLARLQLELQAWESIRDAQMEHRAEQVALEARRRQREANLELGTPVKDLSGGASPTGVLEGGISSLPDSAAKFKEECECLAVLKALLEERRYSELGPSARRLYGERLYPRHERGQLIGYHCQVLMNPEGREPFSAHELDELMKLVEAEENDILDAWDLLLTDREISVAARRAQLAPTREDHWMNRQGDRLRSAIDRKMRFTPALLKLLGLAQAAKPASRQGKRSKMKKTSTAKAGMCPEINRIEKKMDAPKAGMSFRINETHSATELETDTGDKKPES